MTKVTNGIVQVTWHFYIGMLAFLNGEDKKVNRISSWRGMLTANQADEELSWALEHCPLESKRNQE
jgi:hypothetical protein